MLKIEISFSWPQYKRDKVQKECSILLCLLYKEVTVDTITIILHDGKSKKYLLSRGGWG